MTKKKQSKQDRLERLKRCCCPVHGTCMAQVGNEDEWFGTGDRYIAGCCRKDCEIKGFTTVPHGEVELLPEFQYLLKE